MPKVLTSEKDVLFSPWTTGLNEQFEIYHFNEHEFEMTELINLTPELLKDIEKARESLKDVKFYDDKDIFGT